jgi:hypothetical protein
MIIGIIETNIQIVYIKTKSGTILKRTKFAKNCVTTSCSIVGSFGGALKIKLNL